MSRTSFRRTKRVQISLLCFMQGNLMHGIPDDGPSGIVDFRRFNAEK